MSSLGMYFGLKGISIVETKGKKILNNIQIPYLALPANEPEESLPEDVKIVALLKDELRRNKITAKKASVALSGKDLIIRIFEMPVLPRQELQNAVEFEAKKYIPFKVEDLVSDFESKFDKSRRKNLILFVGIKKETLDKYLSILGQLNIKTQLLEHSAFSLLRLLKLSGISDKGVIGVISADFEEEDEVNFTVLENGFPLFTRDITLFTGVHEPSKTKDIILAEFLDKFKTELRISLDYYDRKFPAKNIEKAFFITGEDQHSELETFVKDIGLPTQFVDIRKFIVKLSPLSLIKSYSCSLAKIIKTRLKVNLAETKAKIRPSKELALSLEAASLFTNLRIDPRIAVSGLLTWVLVFIIGLYLGLPLQKNLKETIALRPQTVTVSPDSNYAELTGKDSEYKTKVTTWNDLIRKQVYLSEPLNVIPQLAPDGLWLADLSFRKEENRTALELEGMAYLGDNTKEIELVNIFLSSLKKEPTFNKYFKEIKIVSLDIQNIQQRSMVRFKISALNYQKERQ